MNHSEEIQRLQSQLEEERRARHTAETAVRNMSAELGKVQEENTRLRSVAGCYKHDQPREEIERHYQHLYNHSQALICTHDMEGRLLSVNPATCKAMGYTEEELVGSFIFDFIPENVRHYFQSDYLPSINTANKAQGVLCVISKSGDTIYLLFDNHKMQKEGKEPYVIGFSQDISDRIRIEHELMLAKQASEEGAQAKEVFLANMSHEIRTPINGILGMAGLLSKTELDNRQHNFLKLIQESANNLLVIVNDVLDLEKIIAGKLTLEQIPFRMVDKISLIVQSFIYRAEEKGVAIIYQNAIPSDLIIVGDPFRLSQILNNILSNAIKFTESGSITITTRIRSFENETVDIEFTIKDTGIGISEEKIKEIFKPFVQADPAISRKYGGTGLGLTICKNLLDMQNGSMKVTSRLHEGSTFTFNIPYKISEEKISVTEAGTVMDYASLGRKKVLVAEDVEINQFIARHIMESWGFEVTVVGDGKQAVQMVTDNDYDIVLMDIQMPEMDGITAMGQIRAMPDPRKASLPIVALTANALKGDSEKYISAGMNDYLSKPFAEATLFEVIARNLTDMKTKLINMKEPQTLLMQSYPTEKKLYDLTTIRMVSGDDEEFVKKMVSLFIETVPGNLKEMNTALDKQNWDMVSKTAHKLKSTLDSMGIDSLRQDIRTVELNAKQKDSVSVIPPLVHKINTVIRRCIVQLEDEILQTA